MSDSDIRAAPDLLATLAAEFENDRVDLLTCPYRAVPGPSPWSTLEALGLNTEFLGGLLVARLVEGVKFAVGPTIAARKSVIEALGGFGRFREYLAEDFVLGKLAAQSWLRRGLVLLPRRAPYRQSRIRSKLSAPPEMGTQHKTIAPRRLRWANIHPPARSGDSGFARRSRLARYLGPDLAVSGRIRMGCWRAATSRSAHPAPLVAGPDPRHPRVCDLGRGVLRKQDSMARQDLPAAARRPFRKTSLTPILSTLVGVAPASPPKSPYFFGAKRSRRRHHALAFPRPLRGLALWDFRTQSSISLHPGLRSDAASRLYNECWIGLSQPINIPHPDEFPNDVK